MWRKFEERLVGENVFLFILFFIFILFLLFILFFKICVCFILTRFLKNIMIIKRRSNVN